MAALRHCAILAPLGLLAYLAEITTWPFALEAVVLSAGLGAYSLRFAAAPSQQAARKLFRASLLYLPVLMAAMAVHRVPNLHSVTWEQMQAKVQALLAAAGAEISAVAGVDFPAGGVRVMEGLREAAAGVAGRIDGGMMFDYVTKCPSKVHCKELEGSQAVVATDEVAAANSSSSSSSGSRS